MSCFAVPAAEAVITTVAAKIIKSKEATPDTVHVCLDGTSVTEVEKIPFSRKMKWLNNMLWGGSALLAFEHVWHGELTPWFPFLTTADSASGAAKMLYEMSTAGVTMSLLVTAVWAGMLAVSNVIEKRAVKDAGLLESLK